MRNNNIASLLLSSGLSLEEANNTPEEEISVVDDGTSAEEIIAAAQQPEDETALEVEEVVDEAEKIEDGAEEAAEATEVAVALEALVDNMRAALGDGGMSYRESQYAHDAANALLKRLHVSAPYTMSSEAWASADERVTATTLTVESWNEKLKSVIDTILAHLKKLIEAGKEWWKNLGLSVNKLLTRCTALEKQAKLLKTDQPSDTAVRSLTASAGDWASGEPSTLSKNWTAVFSDLNLATIDMVSYTKKVRAAISAAKDGEKPELPPAPQLGDSLPRKARLDGEGASIKLVYDAPIKVAEDAVVWAPNKSLLVGVLDSARKALTEVATLQKDWSATEAVLNAAKAKLDTLFKKEGTEAQELHAFQRQLDTMSGLPQGWAKYVLVVTNALLKGAAGMIKHWEAADKAE